MSAAGTSDPDRIVLQTMTFGSIIINTDIAANPGDDLNAWANGTISSLANMDVGGLSVVSSTATPQNIETPSAESSVNLGLLLGVSIPLVVLRKSFDI